MYTFRKRRAILLFRTIFSLFTFAAEESIFASIEEFKCYWHAKPFNNINNNSCNLNFSHETIGQGKPASAITCTKMEINYDLEILIFFSLLMSYDLEQVRELKCIRKGNKRENPFRLAFLVQENYERFNCNSYGFINKIFARMWTEQHVMWILVPVL